MAEIQLTARKSCSFRSISSFCSAPTDDTDFDVTDDDLVVTWSSSSAGAGGGGGAVSVAATNFCHCCVDGLVFATASSYKQAVVGKFKSYLLVELILES